MFITQGQFILYILPVLKQCVVCPLTNRKEETVIAQLHIGHSFIAHSFLLKGEESPKCIRCDELLDHIEIRERRFTAQSLHALFQEISPEKIFNFLNKINIF